MADSIPQTKDGFENISFSTCCSVQDHSELFNRFFHMILNQEEFKSRIPDTAGPELITTNDLLSLTLDDDVETRNGIDDTIQLVQNLMSQLPDRSHPFYLSRYGGGNDPHGIIGDVLATVLSSPVCTYLACPVFTLMEETLKTQLCSLIWNEERDCHGDGTVCPGRQFSGVLALRAALYKRSPATKENGLSRVKNSAKFAVFISQDGNEFTERECILVGLGTSSCFRVRTDWNGRMDMAHLVASVAMAKSMGMTPFLVIATIGTSTQGAIDPIAEISTVCHNAGMWLHIDGVDAGGYVFSKEFRATKLAGIDKADSFAFGGGVLGLACPASVIVSRTDNSLLFKESFSVDADDTYDPNNLYDYTKYDNGNNTIQTSRRPEILPYWFLWKGTGTDGLSSRVEHVNGLAFMFHQLLESCPTRFHLLTKTQQTPRIAFYYIPKTPWVVVGSPQYSQFMKCLAERLSANEHIYVSIDEKPMTHFIVSLSNYMLSAEGVTYIFQAILYYADLIEQEMFGFSNINIVTEWKSTRTIRNVGNNTMETYKPVFEEFFGIISNKCLYFANMRQDPSFVYVDPVKLMEMFDFSLKTRINSTSELFRLVTETILWSAHQAHPYYVFQVLAAGLDPIAIMGDIITAVAPVDLQESQARGALIIRTMELEIFKNVGRLIGYPEDCGGMICPGGSICNMSAMALALFKTFPQLRTTGVVGSGLNPVLFAASNAHYSFHKGAMLFGLGTKSVISVSVDKEGRMIPSELERAIKSAIKTGQHPFFVAAIAGTTDIGVYDRVDDIVKITKRFGLWLHVDAAIGGSLMMDEGLAKIWLKGVNSSDSFSFNPHKWLGVPLESSVMVVKDKREMETLQAWDTSHTFWVETVFQYQRRAEVLKFWLIWKVKGVQRMKQHIQYTLSLRDYALSSLSKRNQIFKPWRIPSEVAQVCFYYLPKSLRSQYEKEKHKPKFLARLSEVAIPLTSKITANGKMMLGVTRDGEHPWLVRIMVMNSGLVPSDIDYLLDEIDKAGEDMIF